MARNRQIKAEFWCDKKINSLSPIVQLLFIGTWNFADDSGVCRADITYLQSNIFPYTSVTKNQIKEARVLLIEKKLLLFGIYNDEEYVLIKNFKKHQKIDHPSKFRYISVDYKTIFELEINTRRALDEHSSLNVKENVNENVNVKEKENENLSLEEKELEKYKTYLETVKSSGDLGSRERNFLYSFARKSKANNPIAYVLTLISNGTFKDILLEEFIRLQKEKEREKEKERPPAPILTPEEEKAQKERTQELIKKAKRWGKTH